MSWRTLIFGFLVASLALAACEPAVSAAEQETRVREATAAALPGISAHDVMISKFERHSAKTTWAAAIDGKVYSCDADEVLRLPSCQQVS